MKSVGKNARHVQIKYFIVTDRVKDKEVNIIYYSTKEMVADFLLSHSLRIDMLFLE